MNSFINIIEIRYKKIIETNQGPREVLKLKDKEKGESIF